MARMILLVASLLSALGTVRAQLLGGFFNQAATQLKEYAGQIAALQAYGSELAQGYGIVESGIADIGAIKEGEFSLHRAYFGGLAAVNPLVADMPEVEEIVNLEPAVLSGFSAAIVRWRTTGGLTAAELVMVEAVYSELEQLGVADLGSLEALLSAGQLSMGDAERIVAVREIDRAVRERYGFVQEFCVAVEVVREGRRHGVR